MRDRALLALLLFLLIFVGALSLYLIWPPDFNALLSNLATETIGILLTLSLVGLILSIRNRLQRKNDLRRAQRDLGALADSTIRTVLKLLNLSEERCGEIEIKVVAHALDVLSSDRIAFLADAVEELRIQYSQRYEFHEELLSDSQRGQVLGLVQLTEKAYPELRYLSWVMGYDSDQQRPRQISGTAVDHRRMSTAVFCLEHIINTAEKLYKSTFFGKYLPELPLPNTDYDEIIRSLKSYNSTSEEQE